MLQNSRFFGTNPLFWFGVVEDRDDSKAEDGLMLGRVRVRILGYHSELYEADDATGEGIKVERLQWATPIMPVTSASMHGIGSTPLGLVEGTHVFGIALDGRMMQDLYVLGSMVGVPGERRSPENQGFCDPNDVYPKDDYLGEEDTNRLACGRKITETIVQDKKDNRVTGIETAGGQTWDEPLPAYNSKYPFNHVTETESGHIVEYDDTEGAERTHRYHRAGTFEEIDKDGARMTKVQGDDFEITLKNKHLYVKGNLNITVDGNAQFLVKGNSHTKTEGDAIIESVGNMVIKSGKNIDMSAAQNIKVSAGQNISVDSGQSTALTAGQSVGIDASNNVGIKAGNNISEKATNKISMKSTGGISAKSTGDVSYIGANSLAKPQDIGSGVK
jgi:hypothetical protein